jgi:hypothetical protein
VALVIDMAFAVIGIITTLLAIILAVAVGVTLTGLGWVLLWVSVLQGILAIVFLVAIWRWKRWGFYGISVSLLLALW